jgi:hypothetical protein
MDLKYIHILLYLKKWQYRAKRETTLVCLSTYVESPTILSSKIIPPIPNNKNNKGTSTVVPVPTY